MREDVGEEWRAVPCSPMGWAVENIRTGEWTWYATEKQARDIAGYRNTKETS